MKQIKTVALIGLGAIGSFFVPNLSQSLGEGFSVVAGGTRRERLQSRGVVINQTVYRPAIIDPSEVHEPVDLVICAVKAYSLEQALDDISNIVGPDTLILPVQNGVESEQAAMRAYGANRVLYSFMRISIVMTDGVANFDPQSGGIYFGDAHNDAPFSLRVQQVKELFDRCGLWYRIEPDMVRSIWFKYMCNIGENMTCALLHVPFGAFRNNEDANWIRKTAMREVVALAQAQGIALSEEDIALQEATLVKIPAENKPSTLQDLEAGRHTEIDLFAGTVMRMGDRLGIDTPLNDVFYHAIKVYEAINDGSIDGVE